jgi:ribosomal subunit interface protein
MARVMFENSEDHGQHIRIARGRGGGYNHGSPNARGQVMELQIRSEGFRTTAALHAFTRERLDFALDRFRGLVAKVRVRLSDDNGPRGGIDKRCRFEVRLRGAPAVLIDERSDDLYTAIARAAQRVERQVARLASARICSRRQRKLRA